MSCRDETLKAYFLRFGPLEHAEVMKDRYTGKSRGFGFVSFVECQAAGQALLAEHTIDGRRCEAKVALPKVRDCMDLLAYVSIGSVQWTAASMGNYQGLAHCALHACQLAYNIMHRLAMPCLCPTAVHQAPCTDHQTFCMLVNLMQGEPTPPRTTRIFVARIPPSVTEAQFRAYFEGFGKLQVRTADLARSKPLVSSARQLCTSLCLQAV